MIQVSDETKAKAILEESSGVDGEHSEHKETSEEGGKISFDSLSGKLPEEVKNVAFLLQNNELSDAITVRNISTNQTNFYIVKMIANEGKGNDRDKYLDELTEIAQQTLLKDSDIVSTVIVRS